MIDYLTLKNSYVAAIHMGLELGFRDPKQGNELLYEFCKKCVDNSNYSEQDKQNMKLELALIKETFSKEIELRNRGAQQ